MGNNNNKKKQEVRGTNQQNRFSCRSAQQLDCLAAARAVRRLTTPRSDGATETATAAALAVVRFVTGDDEDQDHIILTINNVIIYDNN